MIEAATIPSAPAMADSSKGLQALRESKPPATDTFTYLTIIGEVLSPEILPELNDILQDAQLTQDIGWDLVEMLVPVQGSEQCLETIAQLGNPREVILKVLEVLEKNVDDATDDEDDDQTTATFVNLVGMLSILHKRLNVARPSRFVHTTLQSVYRTYHPRNPEMTAAVIALIRSLSGEKRPPLPTRQSSNKLDTPFTSSDPTKHAPDPEALAPTEPATTKRLLQSFITCIIEAYVNCTSMEWASRLLEFYNPERVVIRKSMLRAFKEDDDFLARDALVGQLVALAGDLGLTRVHDLSVKEIFEGSIVHSPLSIDTDALSPSAIKLSTGGVQMTIFPDHNKLLQGFLGDDPQTRIVGNPGTTEALVVMGLYLENYKRISPSDGHGDFMPYHHLLTLVSVFHPSLTVRNVATTLAGLVLHDDPDDNDRLKILEDLLENCIFSALQASAVTWLREEVIIAHKRKLTNRFASTDAIDTLQYALFPNLAFLKDQDATALWEYWVQNFPFHLQLANFAYFLFAGTEFQHLVPASMPGAVEQRYVEPLLHAAKTLQAAVEKKEIDDQGQGGEVFTQLEILTMRLKSLPLQ
uniref:Yap-binding protein n=1 Tax=Colletotrichum fructicola (strain Nara gc5) TaxID=1213859 RepID=L2FP76_COLFN